MRREGIARVRGIEERTEKLGYSERGAEIVLMHHVLHCFRMSKHVFYFPECPGSAIAVTTPENQRLV